MIDFDIAMKRSYVKKKADQEFEKNEPTKDSQENYVPGISYISNIFLYSCK